jgi:hypothetical protein
MVWGDTPDGPASLAGKSLYSSPVLPKGLPDESLSGLEAFLDENF